MNINNLPDEIITIIFTFLLENSPERARSKSNMTQHKTLLDVCNYWNRLARQNCLNLALFKSIWPCENESGNNVNYYEKYSSHQKVIHNNNILVIKKNWIEDFSLSVNIWDSNGTCLFYSEGPIGVENLETTQLRIAVLKSSSTKVFSKEFSEIRTDVEIQIIIKNVKTLKSALLYITDQYHVRKKSDRLPGGYFNLPNNSKFIADTSLILINQTNPKLKMDCYSCFDLVPSGEKYKVQVNENNKYISSQCLLFNSTLTEMINFILALNYT
jgi:hypothetical protein